MKLGFHDTTCIRWESAASGRGLGARCDVDSIQHKHTQKFRLKLEMEPFSKPRASLFSVFLVLFVNLQLSSAGDCPADGRTWVPSGGRCYHFVHGEEDPLRRSTFQRATDLCYGFELLSIQSKEENDFILKYSPEVWKGNTNVWLGLHYDTTSDEMRGPGDRNLSYTNWEADSSGTSGLVPVDTCAALHTSTGQWEKVSCLDHVENGVVCETSEKEVNSGRQKPSAVLSVLVVLSVVVIMSISAVIWFLHQKRNPGTAVFTPFEYHPPFGAPYGDRTGLVGAEETP